MKILVLALAMFALFGCEKQAEMSQPAGVGFQVDKLFTVDGCTVYRFRDFTNPRYFTNCKGSTEWRESCGKNCSKDSGVYGGAQ